MSLPLQRVEFGEFGEFGEPDEPSDVQLIAAVRSGDAEAYETLYRRHAAAAHNLARQLTRSRAERDDLVAEAFMKVLDTLRAGGGPDIAFRAYLLTTLRNTLYDRVRRDRRLQLSDDMTRHDPGVPWVDTAVADLEASLAARAFARLPERWQTVLWHTEVEQETPAQVAPVLGLSPNGVAALAYRAREGLRQAYLQEHLADASGELCRYAVERLGAWARGGLSRRDQARVEEHLAECDPCRLLASEVADVNSSLRGLILPAVLGGGALAAGYLAAAAPEAAAAGGAAAGAGGATAGTVGAGTVGAGTAGAGTAGAGTATAGTATAGTATAGTATAGAGTMAAGTTAAGAGTVAAGTTAAGAGTIAAGTTAAGAGTIAAGTTAAGAGGGSVFGTVASWVAGSQIAQASAAAIAAVVVGGAVVVGLGVGPGSDSRPPEQAISAPASDVPTPGLPIPGEATDGPGSSGIPGEGGGQGVPGGPEASGGSAPGDPTAGQTPGRSGTGQPSQSGAPAPEPGTAPAILQASGVSAPILVRGRPALLKVAVSNTGESPVRQLTAVVDLPDGIVFRGAGGIPGAFAPGVPAGDPQFLNAAPWMCTRTGAGVDCTLAELAGETTSTLQVLVFVGTTATSGTVSGKVTGQDVEATIPPSTLVVTSR
jgi:RNA polymerase sigma factor (sigma-70 family)